MSSGGSRGGKKGVNFELNLVPFIDVLSVCICFLLVTTVFMSLGSFHASQAIGDASSEQKASEAKTLMVSFGDRGELKIDVNKGEQTVQSKGIPGSRGKVNLEKFDQWLAQMSEAKAEFKTVLLLPNPVTKYDDLIQVMSQLRKNSYENIGVAPL